MFENRLQFPCVQIAYLLLYSYVVDCLVDRKKTFLMWRLIYGRRSIKDNLFHSYIIWYIPMKLKWKTTRSILHCLHTYSSLNINVNGWFLQLSRWHRRLHSQLSVAASQLIGAQEFVLLKIDLLFIGNRIYCVCLRNHRAIGCTWSQIIDELIVRPIVPLFAQSHKFGLSHDQLNLWELLATNHTTNWRLAATPPKYCATSLFLLQVHVIAPLIMRYDLPVLRPIERQLHARSLTIDSTSMYDLWDD
jgi:hypothetical protein